MYTQYHHAVMITLSHMPVWTYLSLDSASTVDKYCSIYCFWRSQSRLTQNVYNH